MSKTLENTVNDSAQDSTTESVNDSNIGALANETGMNPDTLAMVRGMSVDSLKALLQAAKEEARKAEQAKKQKPRYAFLVVMSDSSIRYWSDTADSVDEAKALAVAYAESNAEDGVTVFCDSEGNPAVTFRPLPNPKGRKPKA